jgi:putative transposase
VKTMTATLAVSRSNIIERQKATRPRRGPQNRIGDIELAADIRRLVDQRPSYGYRRIAALLKRRYERKCGSREQNAKKP